MPEDPHRPPDDRGDAPERRDRSNVAIWAGLGCLGVIVLSCVLLGYWARTFGPSWILNQGEEARSYGSAVALGLALQSIRQSCVDGITSEDAEQWFNTSMPSAARNTLCKVDEATIEKIVSPDQVLVETLSETGDSALAVRAGLDPTFCYRYTTDAFRVTGCFDAEVTSGIPYKILSAEEVAR